MPVFTHLFSGFWFLCEGGLEGTKQLFFFVCLCLSVWWSHGTIRDTVGQLLRRKHRRFLRLDQ